MAKPAISLQIPAPCAESWEAMTPQGAGRHCASCQHVVVDFSGKTDAEILAILGAAAGGRTCGRFRGSQLSRPLQPPLPARHKGWSAAVAATVALLLGRSLVAPETRAQAPTNQHPTDGRHSPEPELGTRLSTPKWPRGAMEAPAADLGTLRQITGQITDRSTGEGLPGVTILLQGTQHGVSTNSDGSFTLLVDSTELHCPLSISSIGYVKASFPQPVDNQPLQIALQADTRVLSGELMVVGGFSYAPIYTPRGLWNRMRSIPYRVGNLFR